MATVYLAHDLRYDRQVALKVLRPGLASTLGPEGFINEIRVAARLTHPHILPVHDSGEAAGFLFSVMPYIDGETLREAPQCRLLTAMAWASRSCSVAGSSRQRSSRERAGEGRPAGRKKVVANSPGAR